MQCTVGSKHRYRESIKVYNVRTLHFGYWPGSIVNVHLYLDWPGSIMHVQNVS
jgi:hypothetical protein